MSLGFSLNQWSMDVVANDGEVVAVRAAELHFAALHVHYASLLHARGSRTHASATLRPSMPVLADETVTWSSRALGAHGTWRAEGPGVRETLYRAEPAGDGRMNEGDEGAVEWNCVMPLAQAEVTLDGGRVVRGLGYAAQLRVGVAPFELPIKELRWGRFAGDGASLVWLDWSGPHGKRIIVKNGARVRGALKAEPGEGTIDLEDDEGHLKTEGGRVLREGTLGAGALAVVAELHGVLPERVLAVRERVAIAAAVLEAPFASPPSGVKGWVLSETLTWP